mmetsp:Transcript_47977/g.114008  ORF Transcript_47977/g.114008 Transcript_47977/m.114008 type:complete len:721 (+) Transcript_47977:190-2352(+)
MHHGSMPSAFSSLLLPQQGGVRDVAEDDLPGLNVLAVTVQIVTYEGTPRNLYANGRALEALGVSSEQFLAQVPTAGVSENETAKWKKRYQAVQLNKETILERDDVENPDASGGKLTLETVCNPVNLRQSNGEQVSAVMITAWPVRIKAQLAANTTYMTSLLELSPYPLCFFTFDGHLITCNPAAVAVFGKTIWLQSDIFGMEERERRGIQDAGAEVPAEAFNDRFVERTERLGAYEEMMDALSEEGATYEVDLPIKRLIDTGEMVVWYCRVWAQRHKDPFTGSPIIMISHQDVTNLRKVEGELGRMQMLETTEKELMKHDQDVAGSLLVLLGEEWGVANNAPPGAVMGNIQDDSAAWAPGRMPMSQGGRAEAAPVVATTRPAGPDVEEDAAKSNQLHGLRECLDAADSWKFNVFDLESETDGLPLQVLAWHLFVKHDLIKEFNLDHVKLVSFLRHIESGHLENPYHNSTHVADVLQSFHWLVLQGGIRQYVGQFEVLAGIIAAIIHDFEHKGFNNDFLIKTQDEWALDSNDRSPNENHHLSSAFRILRHQDCNFLHRMPHAQQMQLRKLIIEMVLATDMAEHMAIVSRLKNDIQKRLENPDDGIPDEPGDALKSLVLQGAIKMADVGHLYAQHDVHLAWSERLEEELWLQGDVEKQLAMKISFLMDRDSPGVTKSQPGFFDFVVRPLFDTWCSCFPESSVLVDRIESNYQHWKSKESLPS